MIAIGMRFLAGRLHATPWGHHVNEGVVEYPPSLFRLLRSLIATARRACLNEVTEGQLRGILAALRTPPEFYLPQAAVAHTRHYDQANSGVKFFDTFIALRPQDVLVWVWRSANLDEGDRLALTKLLTALGTFGRAESWCEAVLLGEAEAQGVSSVVVNSLPFNVTNSLSAQETIRLLMPQEELDIDKLMKVLATETSAMRKNKQLEPTGTRWLTYARPAGILTPHRFRMEKTKSKTQAVKVVAHLALDSPVLPLAQDVLTFCEQVRRALIRNRIDTSHSETITGKLPNGSPLEGHEHAHYFPTDEDRDGRIDHITIYAPRGFDDADLEALGSLSTIFRRGNRPEVRMVLTGLGSQHLLSEISIFAEARRWTSVTPFSLPRFSNRGGGKPPRPRDLPEAQLVRELRSRGLPEPVSIKRIDGYQVNGRPLVRWLEFNARRYNGTQGHGLAGFEIEFDRPVGGPIALGFGCHFGLGLFLPSEDS